MPRLKDTYMSETVPAMMKKFGYKNVMQVPKLEKIVINMGLGDTKDNPKSMDHGCGRACDYSGAEAGCNQSQKECSQL